MLHQKLSRDVAMKLPSVVAKLSLAVVKLPTTIVKFHAAALKLPRSDKYWTQTMADCA
jgi:hypothetical protein